MPLICPSRTTRRPAASGATITSRDLDILRMLATAAPVTANQVARFVRASDQVARRRLRSLRDQGLVKVFVVNSVAEPSRYCLSARGRDFLCEQRGLSSDDVRVFSGLSKMNLPHHDGAVETWLSCNGLSMTEAEFTLSTFLFEAEIRDRLHHPMGVVVPDAIAAFQHRHFADLKVSVAIEVDRGTENPSWFLAHKGCRFAESWRAGDSLLGCTRWFICCRTVSTRRVHRLVMALWDGGAPEGLWYFATDDELRDQAMARTLWWTPRLSGDGETAGLVRENPFETITAAYTNGRYTRSVESTKESSDLQAWVEVERGGPSSSPHPIG